MARPSLLRLYTEPTADVDVDLNLLDRRNPGDILARKILLFEEGPSHRSFGGGEGVVVSDLFTFFHFFYFCPFSLFCWLPHLFPLRSFLSLQTLDVC